MARETEFAGTYPTIGDVWKEVDPRFERYVRVVAVNTDWVRLRKCAEQGWFDGSRVSTAAITRFHGLRGGYKLHRAAAGSLPADQVS